MPAFGIHVTPAVINGGNILQQFQIAVPEQCGQISRPDSVCPRLPLLLPGWARYGDDIIFSQAALKGVLSGAHRAELYQKRVNDTE